MIRDFIKDWLLNIQILLSNAISTIIILLFLSDKFEHSTMLFYLFPFTIIIPMVLYDQKVRKFNNFSNKLFVLSFLKLVIIFYVLRSILDLLLVNLMITDNAFDYDFFMFVFDIMFSVLCVISAMLNPRIFLKLYKQNFLIFFKLIINTILYNIFQAIFVSVLILVNLILIMYSPLFVFIWYIGFSPIIIIWVQKHVDNSYFDRLNASEL